MSNIYYFRSYKLLISVFWCAEIEDEEYEYDEVEEFEVVGEWAKFGTNYGIFLGSEKCYHEHIPLEKYPGKISDEYSNHGGQHISYNR